MSDWITILALISLGIVLLVIEIIVVPGTTVVGLVGFVLMLVGVSLCFKYFGSTAGWTTGTGTAVSTAVILYFCFKSDVWSRFASKATINSRVNEGEMNDLSVGTEGVAVSALRPFGKAELKGKVYEVKTLGDYMDSGKGIRIVEILSHQITVEQIN